MNFDSLCCSKSLLVRSRSVAIPGLREILLYSDHRFCFLILPQKYLVWQDKLVTSVYWHGKDSMLYGYYCCRQFYIYLIFAEKSNSQIHCSSLITNSRSKCIFFWIFFKNKVTFDVLFPVCRCSACIRVFVFKMFVLFLFPSCFSTSL